MSERKSLGCGNCLQDLPLAYLLKSNVQRKSCQLRIYQSTHMSYITATNFCLFCTKKHFSYSLWHLWLMSLFQTFHNLLLPVLVYSLAFALLIRFRFLKYKSGIGCCGNTAGEQGPEHCSAHDWSGCAESRGLQALAARGRALNEEAKGELGVLCLG